MKVTQRRRDFFAGLSGAAAAGLLGAQTPRAEGLPEVTVIRRDFVRSHPVATKRVLRALLKANDICAAEPASVARHLVERGFAEQYDHAHATQSEIPYGSWREFDAEDSMRFFVLRLHQGA